MEFAAPGAGGRGRSHGAGESAGDSGRGAGGSLFSADAWNNITFTAGEVKNPRRNIPLSLILGTGFVLGVFSGLAGYLLVLPMHGDPNGATVMARGIQYATEDRVATAALEQIFHSGGAYLMAAAILISTFGCANGMTLAGARVYYAMSRTGCSSSPWASCIRATRRRWRACWCRPRGPFVLCVSGSYSQLLDYIIFAVLVFYILTIVGCLCCASSGRMRRGPTRRWAIRCCRRSISSWRPGSVSYYCDTSLSTRGRAWFWFCWAFLCISSGRGVPQTSSPRRANQFNLIQH
jgi:amino acid transporter